MTSPSGSPTSRGAFSPEATAAFAELVARHDRGEAVDFEAEFRARAPIADALRNLEKTPDYETLQSSVRKG